ncbi:MAG: stage II sporulation protein P, partial [Firmicutes bacterium]|nr:stage II sporulation protein P [Bacillota bacterium]
MGRRVSVGLALLLLLVAAAGWYGFRPDARRTLGPAAGGEAEEYPGGCVTVVEPGGQVLDKMARALVPGDELITADGRHYRVREVTGDTAVAELLGMDARLLAWNREPVGGAVPVQAAGRTQEVAIYHTHSSESYVPSDGTAFIPFNGGIFRVGEALANTLRAWGVGVNHDRTPHDPHDNNAYVRSRKTAARLLKNNPVALLDVHRDGIPDADFYRRRVAGQEVSQVRIVVGRQNPGRDANLDFARRMMAYANRLHPG